MRAWYGEKVAPSLARADREHMLAEEITLAGVTFTAEDWTALDEEWKQLLLELDDDGPYSAYRVDPSDENGDPPS